MEYGGISYKIEDSRFIEVRGTGSKVEEIKAYRNTLVLALRLKRSRLAEIIVTVLKGVITRVVSVSLLNSSFLIVDCLSTRLGNVSEFSLGRFSVNISLCTLLSVDYIA